MWEKYYTFENLWEKISHFWKLVRKILHFWKLVRKNITLLHTVWKNFSASASWVKSSSLYCLILDRFRSLCVWGGLLKQNQSQLLFSQSLFTLISNLQSWHLISEDRKEEKQRNSENTVGVFTRCPQHRLHWCNHNMMLTRFLCVRYKIGGFTRLADITTL